MTAITELPETVDGSTLGGLLGLTLNRINTLSRDGVIPKAGRGAYPLQECIRAYVAWAKVNPKGRPKATGDLNDEKLRLTRAQADKAELVAAQARGDLIELDVVRREWTAIATDLRARLLSIAPRVATQAGLDRDASARLDHAIRTALEDIADDRA